MEDLHDAGRRADCGPAGGGDDPGAGARLLYLPPYSPDYNPIENLWSKINTHLRAAAARTFDTLGVTITEAFESISKQDCIGFFGSAGYIALGECALP